MTNILKIIKTPRFILSIIMTGTFFLGTALIINSYLMNTPASISVSSAEEKSRNNQNTVTEELQNNPPIELSEIKGISTENVNKFFSNEISSSLTPSTSGGRAYLLINTGSNKIIGYIDQRDIFIKVYTLPITATHITIYSNESITYVDGTFAGAYFKGQKAQEELFRIDLEELENATINNIFYQNTEFSFYIATSTNDSLVIYKTQTDNRLIESLVLGSDFKNYQVSNVIDNQIYIKNNLGNCFSINLADKNIKPEKCVFLNHNDIGSNILSDSSGLSIVDTQNGEIKILTDLDKSVITEFLELSKDNLVFITKSAQNSVEGSILNTINLSEQNVTQLNLKISQIIIQDIFSINNRTYLIIKGAPYKILKLKSESDTEPSSILKQSDYEDFFEVSLENSTYQTIELLNSQVLLFKN
jgi:hypothetical protein